MLKGLEAYFICKIGDFRAVHRAYYANRTAMQCNKLFFEVPSVFRFGAHQAENSFRNEKHGVATSLEFLTIGTCPIPARISFTLPAIRLCNSSASSTCTTRYCAPQMMSVNGLIFPGETYGEVCGYHYFFLEGSKLPNFGKGKRKTLRYNRHRAIAQRRRGRRLQLLLGPLA